MKKVTLTFVISAFILFATTAFAQKSTTGNHLLNKSKSSVNITEAFNKKTNPNPESILKLEWMGNSFDTSVKIDYRYNSAGDPVLILYNMYNMGQYVTVEHDTLIYDANNRLIEHTNKKLDGSQWVNQNRITTTYNSQGHITEEVEYSWNNNTATWDLEWGDKLFITYGSNNESLEIIRQNKHSSQPTYINEEKDVLYYDDNFLPDTVLIYAWDQSQNMWYPEVRAVNATWHKWEGSLYHPMVTSVDFEYWNGTNWIKGERLTAAYNSDDNLLHETSQYWNGTAYVYDYRDRNEYDLYGNIKISYYEEYDESSSTWDTLWAERHNYAYTANNSINTDIQQAYILGQWVNMQKLVYSYAANIGYAEKNSLIELRVFPNPTADVLNLRLDVNNFLVTVTDLSGRTLLQAQNEYRLNIASLSRGIYLVNVKSEAGNATMKFVKY